MVFAYTTSVWRPHPSPRWQASIGTIREYRWIFVKRSRALGATMLGKPQFSWAASAVVHRTTLDTQLNPWTAYAVVHRTTLDTQVNPWTASSVVYRTTLETQLIFLVGDWVSAPPWRSNARQCRLSMGPQQAQDMLS